MAWTTVFLGLTLAALASASAPQLQYRKGSDSFCHNGVSYDLAYETTGVPDSNIYDLNSLGSMKSVTCDIDSSKLRLEFHSIIDAAKYFAIFNEKYVGLDTFLTGGDKFGCALKADPSQGIMLRRVISCSYGATNGTVGSEAQVLEVKTASAKYDDIYESATITLGSSGGCGADKHVCVGVNTDATCAAAASPIPIYQNQFINLACSDCFVALEADVFFTVTLKDWRLNSLQAGLRNATVNAELQLDLKATASWSAGVDKQYALVPHADIISFNIGPVPFALWWEAPIEIKADASLSASAEAIAGVAANINIGDYYVSWDPVNHWSHVTPSPVATFTPVVSGSASFQGSADFSLVPTITMHVNDIFSYGMTLDPEINVNVQGSTAAKQICEQATYDVSLSSLAELKIDIDFLHIHEDRTWGPTQIWTSGNQNISSACTPSA